MFISFTILSSVAKFDLFYSCMFLSLFVTVYSSLPALNFLENSKIFRQLVLASKILEQKKKSAQKNWFLK